MKIIKPQKLSLLSRTFEDDGQAYLVLTAMGFFPFAAPRKLLHEVALWKMAMDQLGRDGVLDAAMTKQRGEVLVTGRAFAKDGVATPGTSVRVQIGSVDKSLYVVGDRAWQTKGPSDPVPFVEMPVTWERAFGGEGFARNPAGRGFKPVEVDGRKVHPLPNVEHPRQLVKSPADRPEPAGFGPIDQSWPQRMELAGTYDQEWLRTRFPGFAKDFKWEFFNVAPADQRIQGYFQLDERFRVEGMHPERRVLESSLPGVTARLFIVLRDESGEEVLREATTRLDTVHLFPNIERGVVIFRGVLPVAEDDAADVLHIIAAFEDPAQPRSPEHYRAVMERRRDKEKGGFAGLIDDDLLPPWEDPAEHIAEDDWNDMAAIAEVEGLQQAFLERKAELQIEEARARWVALGLSPADFDAKRPKKMPPPPKQLSKLPAYHAELERQGEQALAEAKAQETQAMDAARARCAALGIDFDKMLEERKASEAGPPRFSADKELERLRDLAQLGRNAGLDTEDIDAQLADPALEKRLRDMEAQMLEAYRRHAHLFPAARALEADAAARLRAEVEAAHARKESLAGRDLTGADLAGIDLAGADLTEALLEGANLARARLAGAKLRGAALARADLTGADLDGADLHAANFGKANLREARLTGGVDLTDATFWEADLEGASLRGATLVRTLMNQAKLDGVDLGEVKTEYLAFMEVSMRGAKLDGALLDTTVFLRCDLAGADFSRALLPKACIVECTCDGASFAGAMLESTRFAMGTSLAGCDFKGSRMKQTLLRGCKLREADLTAVEAPDCDFSEADCTGARLYKLQAPRSLFVRTVLDQADVRSANLMYAVLQKTRLHGADLRGANLFRADLAKVRGDKATRFDDAYLIQIRVVPEKNQPKVVP